MVNDSRPPTPLDLYDLQIAAARALIRNERNSQTSQPALRIALLASVTVEHWVPILKYWFYRIGFSVDIYVAPFDTIESEILNAASGLYAHRPDVIVILPQARDILNGIPASDDLSAVQIAADTEARRWKGLWDKTLSKTGAGIIHSLPAAPFERSMGNREALSPRGSVFRLNLASAALSSLAPAGVSFFDLGGLANAYGLDAWRDLRFWFSSKHDMAFDAYGRAAYALARTVAGSRGAAKKVCVVDLDDTLWGGVVGDDGVDGIRVGSNGGAEGEAFMAFQRYLRELKEQGVLLAVCSKNESSVAEEPFRKHPGMILKRDDFVAFEANWDDKPANLRRIARTLNIGLEFFVYLDDDPVNREAVQTALPQVTVIELPDDPAYFIPCLSSLYLFESPRTTSEDLRRTDMMAAERKRQQMKQESNGTDLDLPSFLRQLEMKATAANVNESALTRCTQLTRNLQLA